MVNSVREKRNVHLAVRNMNILIACHSLLLFDVSVFVCECACTSGNSKTAKNIMHLLSFGLMICLYEASARDLNTRILNVHFRRKRMARRETGKISEVYCI